MPLNTQIARRILPVMHPVLAGKKVVLALEPLVLPLDRIEPRVLLAFLLPPFMAEAICVNSMDFSRDSLGAARSKSYKILRRSVIPCLFSKFPQFTTCASDDTRTALLFTAARTTRMSRK